MKNIKRLMYRVLRYKKKPNKPVRIVNLVYKITDVG